MCRHGAVFYVGKGGEYCAYKPLLIILNAASVQFAVLFYNCPGVSRPQRKVAARHNVKMRHHPHRKVIAFSGNSNYKIRSDFGRNAAVRGIKTLNLYASA